MTSFAGFLPAETKKQESVKKQNQTNKKTPKKSQDSLDDQIHFIAAGGQRSEILG